MSQKKAVTDQHHVPPRHPETKPYRKKKFGSEELEAIQLLFGDERDYCKCCEILWTNWWDPEIPERRPDLFPKRPVTRKTRWWYTIKVDKRIHSAYHLLLGNPQSFKLCLVNLKSVLETARLYKDPSRTELRTHLRGCDVSHLVPRCIGDCGKCKAELTELTG